MTTNRAQYRWFLKIFALERKRNFIDLFSDKNARIKDNYRGTAFLVLNLFPRCIRLDSPGTSALGAVAGLRLRTGTEPLEQFIKDTINNFSNSRDDN